MLTVGIIIISGFVMGELVQRFRLPKVTGYIIAGIMLNPGLNGLITGEFVSHTDLVTKIALSFIAFSVGGSLLWRKMKRLGKGILSIGVLAGELAFIAVASGLLLLMPLLIEGGDAGYISFFLPVSILMGCLAAPTDPSATVAVVHEYNAKGEVTDTIMGVAAFDDALGIINYSIAVAIAAMLMSGAGFDIESSILRPLGSIVGAVALGVLFGYVLIRIARLVESNSDGVMIVLVLGLLISCFGTAERLGLDELLAAMTMGAAVINLDAERKDLFDMLEKYTAELIFVLFFTLSAMHLKLAAVTDSLPIVLAFVIFRGVGKISGTALGAHLASASSSVKRYTAGGLIPQGGIVIGLALMIRQHHVFEPISDLVIGVVIGSVVIHELIGPVLAEVSLERAGEIERKN